MQHKDAKIDNSQGLSLANLPAHVPADIGIRLNSLISIALLVSEIEAELPKLESNQKISDYINRCCVNLKQLFSIATDSSQPTAFSKLVENYKIAEEDFCVALHELRAHLPNLKGNKEQGVISLYSNGLNFSEKVTYLLEDSFKELKYFHSRTYLGMLVERSYLLNADRDPVDLNYWREKVIPEKLSALSQQAQVMITRSIAQASTMAALIHDSVTEINSRPKEPFNYLALIDQCGSVIALLNESQAEAINCSKSLQVEDRQKVADIIAECNLRILNELAVLGINRPILEFLIRKITAWTTITIDNY